jgi:hypothetical protein
MIPAAPNASSTADFPDPFGPTSAVSGSSRSVTSRKQRKFRIRIVSSIAAPE